MGDDGILREFLVSLGFHVDETSMKKFTTSVEKITKGVKEAGLAVAATATGIIAGVAVISNQMEKLYYASQRTGDTVGNIMALRYAAGQIGLTAEQAQGALEGFARTLRLNPGSNNLLSSLGVTGANPTEKFDSFIEQMKKQKPYVAAAYAGLFGIDPDTLLMLEQGQDKRLDAERQYHEKLAKFGINPDQAAESGKDFNNSIRDLKDTFNDLWIVVESKLAPVLTPLVNQFERFAENHAGEVAQGIADAVQHLANWIQSVNWKKVGDDITSVFHALGGVKGILIGLAAIQLAPLITGVIGLATAVTKLGIAAGGAGLGMLAKVLGPLALLFHSDNLNTGEDADLARRQALAAGVDPKTFDFNGAANRVSPGGSVASGPVGFQPDGTIIEVPANGSHVPRGIRNNNPGNIRSGAFANGAGANGSDGGFATFASMEQGIQAAVTLLKSYAARGYDTIKSIISRWAPGNENNTAAYIADVVKKLGISADQHLSGDQLNGVAQAIFSHENGGAYGNVGSLMNSARNTRLGANGSYGGAAPVTIAQTNTFHIDGSSDPQGTARAVGSEQSRVNGDLVRNFSGAFH